MGEPYANIHFFDPTKGRTHYDDLGEPMVGYNYEIIGDNGKTVAPLFGPYANKDEVEAACKREYARHTY
jgi:hypothetical protein